MRVSGDSAVIRQKIGLIDLKWCDEILARNEAAFEETEINYRGTFVNKERVRVNLLFSDFELL